MSHFIKARDLTIIWGDDDRYWRWKCPAPNSQAEIAELIEVWWFSIRGRIDSKQLKQKTSYGAYLVFAPGNKPVGLDKVKARARFLNDINNDKADDEGYTVFLAKERCKGEKGVFPTCRTDGWMELKLGEFYNYLGKDGTVDIRLFNTDSYVKKHLYVVGIELRPF